MLAAFHLGRNQSRNQLTRPGFPRHLKSHRHATLTELLRIPDPDAMAQAFGNLTSDPGTRSDHALSPGHLSMGGKTVRSSKDSEGKAEHVLSAFCSALQQEQSKYSYSIPDKREQPALSLNHPDERPFKSIADVMFLWHWQVVWRHRFC